MSNRIRIFVTGGTFDKEYNELTASFSLRRHTSATCSVSAAAGWKWRWKPS